MRIFLSICLILYQGVLPAQNIDSLIARLNSTTVPPEQRLDILQKLINAYRSKYQYDSAAHFAERRLQLSRELLDEKRQIESLLDLGLINYSKNEYPAALQQLQASRDLSHQINSNTWLPDIYRVTGAVLEAMGEPIESRRNFALSLEESRAAGDSVGMAKALNSLAISFQYHGTDIEKAIEYFEAAIVINQSLKNFASLGNNYYNISVIYYSLGNYISAIEYQLAALTEFERINDMISMQDSYNVIGNVYDLIDDHEKALEYYFKSLEMIPFTHDRVGEAAVRLNIGNLYLEEQKFTEADSFLVTGIKILEEHENRQYIGQGYHNLAVLKLAKGNLAEATYEATRSVKVSQEINDMSTLSKATATLAAVAFKRDRPQESLSLLKDAWVYADGIGDIEALRSIFEQFYQVYDALGQSDLALENLKKFMFYQDSILGEKSIRETTRREMNFHFAKERISDSIEFSFQSTLQAVQIQKERNRRNFALVGLIILALLLALIYRQFRLTQNARRRSDELLLNILPAETANELKQKGSTTARTYHDVTILFTDFQQFTQLAEKLTAEELVAEIDAYFTDFDQIIDAHGLEKIKTNGDAYIAVGGLPAQNQASAKDVVEAALSMRESVVVAGKERKLLNKPFFEMRIGVHTGAVVAGVVGFKKFQFDIWGDAVNIAARMESSGEVGKVNISSSTYALIKDDPHFVFEPRGLVSAKNKGKVKMYFVSQRISSKTQTIFQSN